MFIVWLVVASPFGEQICLQLFKNEVGIGNKSGITAL